MEFVKVLDVGCMRGILFSIGLNIDWNHTCLSITLFLLQLVLNVDVFRAHAYKLSFIIKPRSNWSEESACLRTRHIILLTQCVLIISIELKFNFFEFERRNFYPLISIFSFHYFFLFCKLIRVHHARKIIFSQWCLLWESFSWSDAVATFFNARPLRYWLRNIQCANIFRINWRYSTTSTVYKRNMACIFSEYWPFWNNAALRALRNRVVCHWSPINIVLFICGVFLVQNLQCLELWKLAASWSCQSFLLFHFIIELLYIAFDRIFDTRVLYLLRRWLSFLWLPPTLSIVVYRLRVVPLLGLKGLWQRVLGDYVRPVWQLLSILLIWVPLIW